MILTLDNLVELAKECDLSDPIDFEFLDIKEDDAFKLMAAHVIEILNKNGRETSLEVIAAVCTKLLVENFVLNLKLETLQKTL